MPQRNGVIATTRQTIWSMDLVEALEENSEFMLGFAQPMWVSIKSRLYGDSASLNMLATHS